MGTIGASERKQCCADSEHRVALPHGHAQNSYLTETSTLSMSPHHGGRKRKPWSRQCLSPPLSSSCVFSVCSGHPHRINLCRMIQSTHWSFNPGFKEVLRNRQQTDSLCVFVFPPVVQIGAQRPINPRRHCPTGIQSAIADRKASADSQSKAILHFSIQ